MSVTCIRESCSLSHVFILSIEEGQALHSRLGHLVEGMGCSRDLDPAVVAGNTSVIELIRTQSDALT